MQLPSEGGAYGCDGDLQPAVAGKEASSCKALLLPLLLRLCHLQVSAESGHALDNTQLLLHKSNNLSLVLQILYENFTTSICTTPRVCQMTQRVIMAAER